jgi:hypothetical protein
MPTTLVTEQTIDRIADQLSESEEAFEASVYQMREAQPVLLSHLFSETFEPFTRKEQEFALYLAIVIYESVRATLGQQLVVSGEQLSQVEERNWQMLQEVKAKRFHERLDIFFEDTTQEDLLAFIEDALSDETDEYVTREGREALFVSLKSIVDCLTE